MLALAATLIDHEVSFTVLDDDKLSTTMQNITFGRPVSIEEADFIFLPGGCSAGKIRSAKQGYPEFPDLGATIIYQAKQLTDNHEQDCITLSGPGIEHTIKVSVQGVPKEELMYFTEINCQYPLGIDVLLIDQDNNVMALPRSVKIKEYCQYDT